MAAVAIAPASANAATASDSTLICGGSVTLPSCVDYTFDVAQAGVTLTRNTYNNDVQPVLNDGVCEVYYRVTGERCQSDFVPKL